MNAPLQIPDGFAEVALQSQTILSKQFGVSLSTISVWRKRLWLVGTRAKPVPDDFNEVYHVSTIEEMRKRYNVATETVWKWRDACGFERKEGNVKRPCPDDFREVAPTMFVHDLRKHYRCSNEAMDRWIVETGVKAKCGLQERLPMPADFAENARRNGNESLIRIYGVSKKIVARWRQECGVKSPLILTGNAGGLWSFKRDLPLAQKVNRDGSLQARAADHLRPYYKPVVKVAYTDLAKSHPKDHYLVGRVGVLSPDDMVALARKKGFDPDAWSQVAA